MAEPAKRLAIILVHYHTPALVRRCVESLRADLSASGLEAELIVIDNGNDDAGRALIDSLPVRRIDPGENLGYAAGVNLGARSTQADFFVVMNPDVIVHPGCLAALLAALEAGAAVAGPRIYWSVDKTVLIPMGEDRTVVSEVMRRLATRSTRMVAVARRMWRRTQYRCWRAEQPVVTPTLTGAILAISRETWEKVGTFDEVFKLYFEETDWLLRVLWRGLRPMYVPAAEASHMYNQSAGKSATAGQWFVESEQIFGRWYYGGLLYPLMQRYLAYGTKEIPVDAIPLEGVPEITLPATAQTLWLEISPRTQGFPAAAARVRPEQPRLWRLPDDVWEQMSAGSYTLRIVDDAGNEGRCYRFVKASP